jgi:hypothetical protein
MMMMMIIIIMVTSNTIMNVLQSETLSLNVGVYHWFKRISTKEQNPKFEYLTKQ